ncbi:hypothetical protein [Chitinimonas naiadis]
MDILSSEIMNAPAQSAGWYVLDLGDGQLAQAPLAALEARLTGLYAASPDSPAAVFVRHESEGRLHCSVVVYFSPASSVLAVAFDASPCQAPSTLDTLEQLGRR